MTNRLMTYTMTYGESDNCVPGTITLDVTDDKASPITEEHTMPVTENNEPTVSTEDYQTLWRAFAILGALGGNMADSPYRKAWWELRDVVHLKVRAPVELMPANAKRGGSRRCRSGPMSR